MKTCVATRLSKKFLAKVLVLGAFFAATGILAPSAQPEGVSVGKALEAYDQSVARKDVEAVRTMLAPEILLYEHSVRNSGAKDAFENHLKPEILEGDGLELSFSDVRITESSGLALVTRQYRVTGTSQGKVVDSAGNETLVWKRADGQWNIIHIHYSHACPRIAAAS